MKNVDILKILIAIIAIVEGVNLGIMTHKIVTYYPILRYFGLTMLGVGSAFMIWITMKMRRRSLDEKGDEIF